jgi:hypothetical protein
MTFGKWIVNFAVAVLMVLGSLMGSPCSHAAVIMGGTPPAEEDIYSIQFDQVNLINPIANFPDVPETGDLITVSFGTRFVGQTFGSSYNSLSDTSPTPPLAVVGNVKTMFDINSISGIALGGSSGLTMFTSPLAILFSSGVNFVAFELGHLDPNSPALIEVFDSQGNSLGVFGGFATGINDVSLVETEAKNLIAGISIYVPDGPIDLEGFGLNNIRFGLDEGGGEIPEPGTLVVWSLLSGCALAVAWRQRSRRVPGR